MANEIESFIKVWAMAISSLIYCYFVSSNLPQGKTRLISILPVIFFLTYLPLNLTTISLGGCTAFFLTWLCNFKLILFSFNHGPLISSNNLSCFISTACLPIQTTSQNSQNLKKTTNQKHPSQKTTTKPSKSPLNWTIKGLILALLSLVYEHKDHIHPKIVLAYYCCYIYISMELIFAVVAAMAGAVLGLKVEPQFNEPYLSTSLQDFWGRRWNLMVTNIMRPTIYDPVKSLSAARFGRKWATALAVFSTFLVSGLMHELIFFYFGRVRPTWEVTWFFVFHGLALVVEIVVKKLAEKRRWRLHRAVSGPVAIGFVMVTGFRWFLPPAIRFQADVRSSGEVAAFVGFVKDVGRWSTRAAECMRAS